MFEDSDIKGKQPKKHNSTHENDFEEDTPLSSKNLFLAIALITIFGFSLLTLGNNENRGTISKAELEGEHFVTDLAKISNTAKFYYHTIENVRIKFFVVLGSDSDVHVAMDACDACYRAKKGYIQRGETMVCNNCGKTFPINSIGVENLSGGCWPSYVLFSISGNKIYIPERSIIEKKYMFD